MKKTQNKKIKRINPELPGGFRDYGPAEAIAREAMLNTIKKTFERFGFEPMETPAVERTEILTGGEAASGKIIFNVKGSQEKKSDTSLRFDLTVPLARFLAANPEIPKPFKRYQIGKVWRGERQQAGRYREFMQADIDIVGAKSLDADAEIILLMYETLTALGLENFYIKINNKREAVELLRSYGIPKNRETATLIAIDKKDKLSSKEWEIAVGKASGLKGEKLKEYLWKLSGENMLETTEVRTVREKAMALGVPRKYLIYDASLVRGLGYYTGSVFEAVLTDLPAFGTVFGGGRFDGLTARFSPQELPAVGASLGVDRLFGALESLGKTGKQKTTVDILIMSLTDDKIELQKIRKELIASGIRTSLYLGDDTAFQAQLSYAIKKEIPYVLIYGDREKEKGTVTIKNLQTREQKEVKREELANYFKK